MARTQLILGGARSGKSQRALALAAAAGCARRRFLATAEAFDVEMAERIARHRADRGVGWETIETPLNLAETISNNAGRDAICLVDCLTLWLSNLMHEGRNVEAESSRLCESLQNTDGQVILVSNEVGLGLVPETPLGRRFRDAQGRLNQDVAAVCDRVEFVAAGLPMTLKG